MFFESMAFWKRSYTGVKFYIFYVTHFYLFIIEHRVDIPHLESYFIQW